MYSFCIELNDTEEDHTKSGLLLVVSKTLVQHLFIHYLIPGLGVSRAFVVCLLTNCLSVEKVTCRDLGFASD